jgi:hypothetical protein
MQCAISNAAVPVFCCDPMEYRRLSSEVLSRHYYAGLTICFVPAFILLHVAGPFLRSWQLLSLSMSFLSLVKAGLLPCSHYSGIGLCSQSDESNLHIHS